MPTAVDKVWRRRPAVKSGTITGRDARLTRRRGRLRYYVNGPGLVAGPIQESALVCQPNLRPAAVLPEKLLGLVEETLALRVHIWVTEFGELLQLGTLGGVQLGWHFDVHAHVQ